MEKFNFKQALIEYGIHENLIDDWLIVRAKKKASNTKTALNRLLNQLEILDVDKNILFEEMVVRSWQGFKPEWFLNLNPQYANTKKNIAGRLDLYDLKNSLNNFSSINV